MSNEGNARSVPELRFPDFRSAGRWRTITLGKLSEVVRGGSPRPIDAFLTTAVDGLNWLKIGDVDKEAKFVFQTAEKVRREALTKTRVVNSGDLILSNSMSFGRPYILQIRTCIHDGWIAITSISEGVERDFLYYFILTPSSQSYFADNAAGSGVQNLNADIIKTLLVDLPAQPEQRKIADCLSSLDEMIAAQARKVDALKSHKEGLMQQLFPREGEIQPRQRFLEFYEAKDWETKPLAKICKVLQGYGFPESLQGKGEGAYPFCKVSDISRAVAERGGYLAEAANYVDDDEVSKLRAKVIPKGATVFAKIGEALRLNRRAYVVEECLIDNNATGLKSIAGEAEDYFIFVLSQLIDLNRHCGGAVPSVNKSTLEEIEITVPKPDEQKRIGDCFASLDSLITIAIKELEALKTHKKGLMQQLFPSAEALDA